LSYVATERIFNSSKSAKLARRKIEQLAKKTASDAHTALIETVRGIGYRMGARPAELAAAARVATSHLTPVVNA
jgi:cobyrinic acid a,c-diamide synthase